MRRQSLCETRDTVIMCYQQDDKRPVDRETLGQWIDRVICGEMPPATTRRRLEERLKEESAHDATCKDSTRIEGVDR